MIFWILSPGQAVNELLLGQRVAAQYYECLYCDLPRIRRTYSHCRNCAYTFIPGVAKKSDGFGHWFGLFCPNCEAEIPTLQNLTAWLLIWLTFPLWFFPVRRYGPAWRAREIARQKLGYLPVGDPRLMKPINYWLMGVGFGGFIFIFMMIMFSYLFYLRVEEPFRPSFFHLSAVTLLISLLGGSVFALLMKFSLERKNRRRI